MDFRDPDDPAADARIPLAPMVDILFLLVVFLLSLYALSGVEREMSIDLPEAESSGPIRRGLRDLLVNVRADGGLVLNGRDVTAEEFEATLESLARDFPADTVVIRADGRTPHSRFVSVLDSCRRLGVKSVSIVTVPSTDRGGPPATPEGVAGVEGVRE